MNHIPSWEVQDAVESFRRDQDTARTGYDQELTALLEEYAGRRSAAAHLIRHVAALAVGHAAAAETRADQMLETLASKHAGVIEYLEQQLTASRESVSTYQRILDEKRTLTEQRKSAADPDYTEVIIGNDYRGWTVAQLEEIAYRLRTGGAVDDTPVAIDNHRATAIVPAPNMVTLAPPPPAMRLEAPECDEAQASLLGQHWRLLVGVCIGLTLIAQVIALVLR